MDTFAQREGHCLLSFNSALWIIHGVMNKTTYKSDVWTSADNGSTWTRVVQTSATAALSDSVCLVFNNKMFVIGGMESTGASNNV